MSTLLFSSRHLIVVGNVAALEKNRIDTKFTPFQQWLHLDYQHSKVT